MSVTIRNRKRIIKRVDPNGTIEKYTAEGDVEAVKAVCLNFYSNGLRVGKEKGENVVGELLIKLLDELISDFQKLKKQIKEGS